MVYEHGINPIKENPMKYFDLLLVILAGLATALPDKVEVNVSQTVKKIAELNEQELRFFRIAIFEAGKNDSLMILLKYADEDSRKMFFAKLPDEIKQRYEQRIKEMSDVNAEQLTAAANVISSMLENSKMDILCAQVLLQEKKYNEAAKKYEDAFKGGAGKRDHYYNAACAWALGGNKDGAFRNLDKAVDDGWLAIKEIQDDRDFESLHSDPRWNKLISRLQEKLNRLVETLPEDHKLLTVIKLPEPVLDGSMSVEKTLATRRSVRQYEDEPLTLKEISQLVWSAYGVTEPIPNGPDFLRGGLKTAPSAGALYPLEIYVVAGNVTNLAPGVYKYKPETHELLQILEGDKRVELFDAALNQTWVKDAPASLVYSAVYERNTGKYGERGRERYVCMDVGHSAENVYLQCVALGLGTCAIGAFLDDNVKLVIRMTKQEKPLYIMPIGKLRAKR
jgi:SagB-type dehydrogenase family enzyme